MCSRALFLCALALCASHSASAPTAADSAAAAASNIELEGPPIREESPDVPRLVAHLPSLLREPGCSSASSQSSSSSGCTSCTPGRFKLLVFSEPLDRVRESFSLADHNCSVLLVRGLDREQLGDMLLPCGSPVPSPSSPGGATPNAASAPQCLHLKIRDTRLNHRTITLRLRIEDINDNAPRWKEQPALEFNELDEVGRWRALEGAEDRDAGRNGAVSYSLVNTTPTADFKLEVRTGVLGVRVARPLDRERVDHYNLVIEARDGGEPMQSSTTSIQINIRDSNDNDPKFERSLYEFNVSEEDGFAHVGAVRATDPDADLAGRVTYDIPSMPTSAIGAADSGTRYPFGIFPETGELVLMRPLDYETRTLHEFQVVARDSAGGEGARSATATVRVHVLDINDCEPRITLDYTNEARVERVDENLPENTFVSSFTVSDCDAGDNGNFSCGLATHADDFRIVPDAEPPRLASAQSQTARTRSFKLLTRRSLDSEVRAKYLLEIRCTDRGREPRMGTATLELDVNNLNDNAPAFAERDRYKFQVRENAPIGSFVGQVSASDPDGSPAESLRYSLNSTWLESVPSRRDRWPALCGPVASALPPALTPNCLQIDPLTGRITLQCAIDRESLASFSVLAIANDSGFNAEHIPNTLVASVRVDIEIVDVNEQPPRFENSQYQFSVPESDDPRERLVGRVRAHDCDEAADSAVRYQIAPRQSARIEQPLPFRVDEKGDIYTRGAIDREREPEYAFDVVAVDGQATGWHEQLSATAAVLVRVEDVNDNPPAWLPNQQTALRVIQPRRANEELSEVQVAARDPDAGDNGAVVYSLEEGRESSLFRVNAATGAFSWAGPVPPQRMGPYRVTVIASDGGRPPKRSSGLPLVIDFDPLPPPQSFRLPHSNSYQQPPQYQAFSNADSNRFTDREHSGDGAGGAQSDWLSASVNEIAIACLALILAVLVCLFVLLLVWLRWRAHYLATANGGGSDPSDGRLTPRDVSPESGKPVPVHAISIANGATARRSCPPIKVFSPRSDAAGRASVKVSGSGSWRSPAGAQWPVKCGGGEQIGIPMSAAALAGCDENANANVDGDYGVGVGVGSPLLAQRSHSGRSAASGVTGTQPVADAEEAETGELEEECHGEEGSEDEFGFTTTRGHRRRLPNGRGPSAPISATAMAPNGYGATQCCARRHSNDDQSQSCTDCEQCRREREATAVPAMSQEQQEQQSRSSSSSDRNYDLPASADPTLPRDGTEMAQPNAHLIYRPIAYKPPASVSAAGSATLMLPNGHGPSVPGQRSGRFISGNGTGTGMDFRMQSGPGAAGMGPMTLQMGPMGTLVGNSMDMGIGGLSATASSAWTGQLQSLQMFAAGHPLALYSGQQPSGNPMANTFPAITGPSGADDRTISSDIPGRRGGVWTSQWLAAHTQSKPVIEGSFV